MAQVDFNSAMQSLNNTATTNANNVSFFSLKNDGEEAVVRFVHDDLASFDIVSTHQVQVNGKFRKVSCLRSTANEALDKCPLCATGTPMQQKFFIHLIQYTKNADGTITAEPKVWERSLSYANTLKSYLDNYGPLSDIICKVIRHGVAGDMKTTYEIVPNLNKQIYTDALYPKNVEVFKDYKTLGTVVLSKDYDEVLAFVQTGEFPAPKTATAQSVPAQPAPAPTDAPWNNSTTPAQPAAPMYIEGPWNNSTTPVAPATPAPASFTTAPVSSAANPGFAGSESAISRPVRTY